MKIGQAPSASGVSARTIRCYESIGLVPKADRTDAGHRVCPAADVGTLRFVRRDLGLPTERIRLLVGLWHDQARSSGDVKRVALEHVAELRRKLAELTALCEALEGLADARHGDGRPECPILEDPGTGSVQAGGQTARRSKIDVGQRRTSLLV